MNHHEGVCNLGGGGGKLDSIDRTKKSRNISFGSNRSNGIGFEELIQLDMACSHGGNVPEAVRRLFGLFVDDYD